MGLGVPRTLPLVGIALVLALVFVPSHVNETEDPVDNLGGMLSVVLVGALVLGINFAPVPNEGALALGLLAIAAAATIAFVIRQRRARNPLYDLRVAARPTFFVAACAGIIVFGSLMAAAFVSQQYLQNVLGYSTVEAGAAILPAIVFMVLIAPRSAKLVGARGAGSRCSPATSSSCSPSSGCSSSGTRAAPTGRSRSPTR